MKSSVGGAGGGGRRPVSVSSYRRPWCDTVLSPDLKPCQPATMVTPAVENRSQCPMNRRVYTHTHAREAAAPELPAAVPTAACGWKLCGLGGAGGEGFPSTWASDPCQRRGAERGVSQLRAASRTGTATATCLGALRVTALGEEPPVPPLPHGLNK